jgi:hypothetical protein
MVKGNTQSELNRFFQIRDQTDIPIPKVTAAAFFKARLKFSETAFIDLNTEVTNHFYQHITAVTWNGHRVLAVDGVKYHLPDEDVIHTEFGGQSNQHTDEIPMALGSALYDIHQKIIIDAHLFPYRSDEREMAFKHLQATQAGDLILYDRGYPAFWLMAGHQSYQRDWCMRVKADFNTEVSQFVASGAKQKTVTLTASDQARRKCLDKGLPVEPQTVRLIRITVKKNVYYLMTNLLDTQRYPVQAFKALYHKRWQIEEGYKRQKSWLEIENFTGKSVLSVRQDYHARILSLNLTAIAVFAAQRHCDQTLPQGQYRYQINFAQALSTMKDTIVKCLYGLISMQGFAQLVETIRQALSIIRPGRCFERKKRSGASRKCHPCYKRTL